MLSFYFSGKAEKELEKFDAQVRSMILERLIELKDETLLSTHIRGVKNLPPATHRIRIGNYRLLIERSGDDNDILSI